MHKLHIFYIAYPMTSSSNLVCDIHKNQPGKMRIHKIQNLNVSLQYLKDKGVRLIGIGAEEICDQNLKLILGFVTLIDTMTSDLPKYFSLLCVCN